MSRLRIVSDRLQTRFFPYWLVLPTLLVMVGLVAYPFFYAVAISFTNEGVGGQGHWVGLANYVYLLRNSTFLASVSNTLTIVFFSVVLEMLIGIGLALLVSQRFPARGLIRSVLLLPWATPAFVAYLTWRVLYQPIGGGINLLLTETGLYPHVTDWLGQRATAMPAVIVAYTWRGFPFWFMSILAGLQSIPTDLYEAAKMDGANAWRRFWNVSLPGLKPILVVTALLTAIWAANGFDQVWLLTQGGPSDATMVFSVLAYLGLLTQRIGEAAAVSVAMIPVLAILVFAATGYMDRDNDQ
jgi:ABC-type sugar transport system permease subunit